MKLECSVEPLEFKISEVQSFRVKRREDPLVGGWKAVAVEVTGTDKVKNLEERAAVN